MRRDLIFCRHETSGDRTRRDRCMMHLWTSWQCIHFTRFTRNSSHSLPQCVAFDRLAEVYPTGPMVMIAKKVLQPLRSHRSKFILMSIDCYTFERYCRPIAHHCHTSNRSPGRRARLGARKTQKPVRFQLPELLVSIIQELSAVFMKSAKPRWKRDWMESKPCRLG